MERWSRRIGRHWQVLTWAVGLLVGLLAVAAAFLVLAYSEVNERYAHQAASAQELRLIIGESTRVLRQLHSRYQPACTPDNLSDWRRLQFTTRHVRDIGVLNDTNQLHCTTGLGAWAVPLQVGRGDLRLGDIAIWLRVPIEIASADIRATVLQWDAFNVVVDHNATERIYSRNPGIGWITAAQPVASWVGPGLSRETVDDMRQVLQRQGTGRHTSLMACSTDLLTEVPDIAYVFHERVHCSDVWRRSPSASILVLAFGLALALASALAIGPRLQARQHPTSRLSTLCQPDHVVCVYQPIVSLVDGSLVGCEVLMRLRDGPDIVMPDTVLPAIVEQGLSWQLDKSVSTRALTELGQLDLPSGFRVALNFIPQDVVFERVHPHLEDLCRQHRLAHVKLDIEIVEHNITADVVAQLPRFRASGYLLSVDDFGTGFSNLKQVQAIRPDLLKIDKSFVHDMEERSLRSSLIPQMIDIARAVDAQVIAEGIENPSQAELLKALGVQFGQGYLFGRPMSIEDFRQVLARGAEPRVASK